MQSAQVESKRIATPSELFRIKECLISLRGCEGLSALGRAWLAFYVALVREGYEQIKAPMGAITHAQWLAFGYTKSKRSAFRAHNELEKHGFICRHTLRLGRDSKRTVIDINHNRFTYWTQRPANNILPLPTHTDNHSHVPSWQIDEVTSNPSQLQTTNPERFVSKSLRSKKHANNKKPKTRFDTWRDPRLFTIGAVLREDGEPRAKALYKKASDIISGKVKSLALDLSNWSADKWQSMTIAEREYFARNEFIPALKGPDTMPEKESTVAEVVESVMSACDQADQANQGAYKLIDRPEPPPDDKPPVKLVQCLDEDELAVLKAAQARIAHRQEREEVQAITDQAEHKTQIEQKFKT